MGAWMANSLGIQDLSPWITAWDMNSPEALAIKRNSLVLKKKHLVESGKQIPHWLNAELEAFAPRQKTDLLIEVPKNTSQAAGKKFSGQLYILMDRDCGSTCEATTILLKRIPHALIIGENSSGTYGYGNAGKLLLPNSKILIQVPTRTFVHPYGLYEEKKGLRPDVVTTSKEALSAALRLATK